MKYLSVCSGIEAATASWHPLGWTPVAFSEIEKFPNALLRHHYPHVPNWGDMNKFKEWPDAVVDVLVGGTPCQSFSVAGLRKGLADPRGNLMLVYLAIANRYRPRWLVWENVPGVLSIHEGRGFASFIRGLAELGYHASWRVLDAQYVRVDGLERAVPQRRRRVFVVGYLGNWRRAASVLFEQESLRWHHPPSREAREAITHATASSLTESGRGVERNGDPRGQDPVVAWTLQERDHKGPDSDTKEGHLVVADPLIAGEDKTYSLAGNNPRPRNVIPVLEADARAGRQETKDGMGIGAAGDPMFSLQARKQHAVLAFDETNVTSRENRNNPKPGDPSHPLATTSRPPTVAFSCKDSGHDAAANVAPTMRSMNEQDGNANAGGQLAVAVSPPLRAGGNETGGDRPPGTDVDTSETLIGNINTVRRLTPKECERLMGFPDDYTAVPYNGKKAADGPRYKALGNSMAVNVMRWIGQRIQKVEDIQ